MAKHTPGPWDLDDYNNANFIIRDKSGEYVTTVTKSRYHDNRKDERAEANAHLIASSPDLLDALKSLLSLCESECDGIWTGEGAWEEAKTARDLIAKIEGE